MRAAIGPCAVQLPRLVGVELADRVAGRARVGRIGVDHRAGEVGREVEVEHRGRGEPDVVAERAPLAGPLQAVPALTGVVVAALVPGVPGPPGPPVRAAEPGERPQRRRVGRPERVELLLGDDLGRDPPGLEGAVEVDEILVSVVRGDLGEVTRHLGKDRATSDERLHVLGRAMANQVFPDLARYPGLPTHVLHRCPLGFSRLYRASAATMSGSSPAATHALAVDLRVMSHGSA